MFLTTPEGLRLRYSDVGNGSKTILLVHGWKMSHRVFDLTMARMGEDYRIVAFDNRGMGESDKPKSAYDFDEFSKDVGFVIRELDLKNVTLVGWSMGCSIVLEYMKNDGAEVDRLVLINGPIKLTQVPEFPWSMTDETLDNYLQDLVSHWPSREREFTWDSFMHPQESVVDWIYHIALQTPLDVIIKACNAQRKLDHRTVLPEINVPVLAVYGKVDPYYPNELANYIASQVPNGQSVIMQNSAHFPFIEEPEVFERVLAEFIQNTY